MSLCHSELLPPNHVESHQISQSIFGPFAKSMYLVLNSFGGRNKTRPTLLFMCIHIKHTFQYQELLSLLYPSRDPLLEIPKNYFSYDTVRLSFSVIKLHKTVINSVINMFNEV